MIAEIELEVRKRGITRLCHFTLVRNFVHVATSPEGILSRKSLEADHMPFAHTDAERRDRHRECICCTVQYPNLWYLRKIQDSDPIFREWVILLLSPDYIWRSGTLFSVGNAAARGGANLAEGLVAFQRLFSGEVVDSQGRFFKRTPAFLGCCPTNQQAEILVPGSIPRTGITGVVVPSVSRARDEAARLRLLGVADLSRLLVVAPGLFDAAGLDRAIREGKPPRETRWKAGDGDAR
jgi:hypothetical protein